jgi:hypothetical protein
MLNENIKNYKLYKFSLNSEGKLPESFGHHSRLGKDEAHHAIRVFHYGSSNAASEGCYIEQEQKSATFE